MDRVYGSWDHAWPSVHGGLTIRSWSSVAAPGLGRSLGLSPMMPLGGGAVEMATQQRSTEAISGALMGRWFWARGWEIGAEVGAMDNGGALVVPFIGS
jgi:hypothetical protein